MAFSLAGLGQGLAQGFAGYARGSMLRDQQEYERQQEEARIKRETERDAFQRIVQENAMRLANQQAERTAANDVTAATERGYRPIGSPMDDINATLGIADQPEVTIGGQRMRKSANSTAWEQQRQQGMQAERDGRLAAQGEQAQKAAILETLPANVRRQAALLSLQQLQSLQAQQVGRALMPAPVAGMGGAGAAPEPVNTTELMRWRGDFDKQTTAERDIASSFSRLQGITGADPAKMTATDDVALIFSYMKMLDPGSVVREGEFATAQQTTGVPGQVLNMYNKALRGERLSPQQRAEMMATAQNIAAAANERVRGVTTRMVPALTSRGINPTEVVSAPFSGLLNRPAPSRPGNPNVNADKPKPSGGFPDYETWKRQRGGR